MRKLMTTAVLAALFLSGCAAPPAPAPAPDESALGPAARKAALQTQAWGLRTKIVQLKQQVVVFEVMLTDVERRAAMSQMALSSLPNTHASAVPAAAPVAARRDADRLSVSVRPAPAAASTPGATDKKKKPARRQP